MTLTTLSVEPEFVLSRTRRARVTQSDWRSGAHLAAVASPYVVRIWDLVWRNDAMGAQRALVQAKWDAMRGPCGVFEWTPPGGSAVAVRFGMEEFRPVQGSATVHAFQVTLEEALNHDG